MDKKKIKELIEKAIFYMNEGAIYTSETTLNEALKELSKSDWISVEDELPPYCKNVLVIAGNYNVATYVTCRVRSHRSNELDKNNFIKQFPFMGMDITHWKHIEKLGE